jgi:CDP-paratose 2-epimerase
LTGRPLDWTYTETNRTGDHIWWVSDVAKFCSHFPDWQLTYDVPRICREIYEANMESWTEALSS